MLIVLTEGKKVNCTEVRDLLFDVFENSPFYFENEILEYIMRTYPVYCESETLTIKTIKIISRLKLKLEKCHQEFIVKLLLDLFDKIKNWNENLVSENLKSQFFENILTIMNDNSELINNKKIINSFAYVYLVIFNFSICCYTEHQLRYLLEIKRKYYTSIMDKDIILLVNFIETNQQREIAPVLKINQQQAESIYKLGLSTKFFYYCLENGNDIDVCDFLSHNVDNKIENNKIYHICVTFVFIITFTITFLYSLVY